MTEIFDWKEKIDNNQLKKCIQKIKKGGIIIFPTETVYGIGANAFNKDSVKKIYEIKKRPEEKPLCILLSNPNQISKYAEITNNLEKKIIEKFMPGPITIILKRKKGILEHISQDKETIGIRIPDNKIILTILNELKKPMVAPSANISGEPSGIALKDMLNDFIEKVDICIDGGKCEIAQSSTIIQVINEEIVILREGKIKKHEIDKIVRREC